MATKKAKPQDTSPFNEGYYRKFYGPKNDRERRELAANVFRMVESINSILIPGGAITRVVDVGAGTGMWRDVRHMEPGFASLPPKVFHSFDISDYAVTKYSLTGKLDIRTQTPGSLGFFDSYHLVICSGVLGYLEAEEVFTACKNLAKFAARFLYVGEVYNDEDIKAGRYDLKGTDTEQNTRSIQFYRVALRQAGFVHLGMGLWVPHTFAEIHMMAFERPFGQD